MLAKCPGSANNNLYAGLSYGAKAFPFSILTQQPTYGGVDIFCLQMLHTQPLWSLLVLASIHLTHSGTGHGTGIL